MTTQPDRNHLPYGGRIQRLAKTAAAAAMLAALAGCVVAPVGPGYHYPDAAVHIGPTYASPGHGYVWLRHHRHGWGWQHPRRGWHRGWR